MPHRFGGGLGTVLTGGYTVMVDLCEPEDVATRMLYLKISYDFVRSATALGAGYVVDTLGLLSYV